MNKTEALIDQLKNTYKGRAWHGPSLMEILEDVDYKHAQRRPLFERHTIWEIVDHMTAWITVPIMTLLSGVYPEVPPEKDWPPMGESEEEWQESKQKLGEAVNVLTTAISKMSDKKYDEIIIGKDYDYNTMLYGVLNHNLYHMGQLSILKKKE